MPGYIGALGRASLGKFELGRGMYRRVGNRITGSFRADGHCSVTWNGRVALTGAWEADGHCSVVWVSRVHIAGMFEADGHCTVVWIGASGDVLVTCIDAGTSSGPTPGPGVLALYDAPTSY
jgi:hypothetical protein